MVNKEQPWINWVKKTIAFNNNEHIWKTSLSTELAIAAQKDKVILPSQYADYTDIFSEWTFDILPPWRDFDHAIDLKELFVLKVAKVYPLNPQEVDMCKEFIEENLKTGRIQPSKSPQASPFFFVKKKDGKLCPVQDYQYLNDHMIKNVTVEEAPISFSPVDCTLISHFSFNNFVALAFPDLSLDLNAKI